MKEIWKQFKKECTKAWKDMISGVKEVFRTTFSLFKDTCIKFITSIFSWIKELVCQLAVKVWELIKILVALVIGILVWIKELVFGLALSCWGFIEIVFAAIVAFLKAVFDLIYNKIIKFIIRW